MGKDGVEFPLPEVLIQHIQSFLSGKEAARTSILSKCWRSAWSTRPNLVFDERDFGINYFPSLAFAIMFPNYENFGIISGGDEEFWKYVAKTIQRYEKLKRKIESFRLWMKNVKPSNSVNVKDSIVKAMKMGAVDFNFEMGIRHHTFTLPYEVLASESLIRLSVAGCKVDVKNVSCWRLESLSLKRMHVEGDIIRDLISKCPLIEKLTLDQISYNVAPGLVVDGPRNLYELCKLKSLFLGCVDVDKLFFSNMSSNFPCLKDLSLDNCVGYNYRGIRLSSPSLEFVSFKQDRLLRANFDLPSIRKFTFSGSSWPSLFFKPVLREWESDISATCSSPSTTWFLRLNELLPRLSSSKLSLSLTIDSIVMRKVDFQSLPKTAVENLTMYAPCSVWFVALECLFWSCRPKFITLYYVPERIPKRRWNNDFLEILRKRSVERVREKCLMMSNEVEDAINVEFSDDECFAESPPVPKKIHFQLRWRSEI